MTERGPFQGVGTIVRFNWPMYLAATGVFVATAATLALAPPGILSLGAGLGLAGSLWFLAGSLGASHWIYDRSGLYRWDWLRRLAEEKDFRTAVICHTGFDDCSEALREAFPDCRFEVIDHYDPERMTEPSIRRARRLFPPRPTDLAAPFDRWPEVTADLDLVLGLLAIHELRSEAERSAWFGQARRHLSPDGRVILVEHVRDAANFIAFGPGFLHFHPVASWRRCWEAAGFELVHRERLTPFVRVFVLVAK